MKITGKTLLHLNHTYYYDDDGYPCGSLQEAREESIDKSMVSTVRRQNCYMKEWDEMNDREQDQAEWSASGWDVDAKPEELVYVFGATTDNLLIFGYWDEFQKDLDNGVYTVVEKKRD